MTKIRSHEDLEVYQVAFSTAMEIFEFSKSFPKEETYSLRDQIRRSSRSVCANIAEAFRKRRYPQAFVAKLSDAEGEAAETQVWLTFSTECNYLTADEASRLKRLYDGVIGRLIVMLTNADQWKP